MPAPIKQQLFIVTNLETATPPTYQINTKQESGCEAQWYKVIVAITAYNANATIDSGISSLFQQTQSHLAVIVGVDANTDDALMHLPHLSKRHGALKIISLLNNVGTFAAKSIGTQYVTGEFFERLKLIYGNEKITVIKKPLTIASHRPNSLMTSEEFGIYNRTAALARLDYQEAWRLWHIDTLYKNEGFFMPSIQQQANATQALFIGIPESIK